MKELINYLKDKYQIEIKDPIIFDQAFIHRSYANETKKNLDHNERLEFLGDAVLELAVTDYLYDNYPKQGEGVMTNWRSALVRGSNLAKSAKKLKLGDYLKLSKGEEQSGGREKEVILAGTFESLVGAIYLDQGYRKAEDFIQSEIIDYLDEIIDKGEYIDSKTFLQEKTQEQFGVTPTYEVVSQTGPDHNKRFVIGVFLDDKLIGKGKGTSKQKGQQNAAQEAIKKLKLNGEEK